MDSGTVFTFHGFLVERLIPFNKAYQARSLFLLLLVLSYCLLSLIMPLVWIGNGYALCKRMIKWYSLPSLFAELFIGGLIAAELLYLKNPNQYSFGVCLAKYCLINAIWSFLRDAVISPLYYDGFTSIRNGPRWIMLSFLSLFQIIFAFAILFQANCGGLHNGSGGMLANIYFSFVTFASIGYGDLYPVNVETMKLVILEICFFLLFIGVKLPLAVSALRVEDETKK
jgi:hypothetical protein